jgi:ribosome biogenesis GTPase
VVVRSYGLFYDVFTPAGTIRCTARGRLKRDRRDSLGIAVGDRVALLLARSGTGVIETLHPRERALTRKGLLRGQPDQVILANANLLLAVFAVAEPTPHLRMLDRFLVLAEANDLDAAICVNKIDLDTTGVLREEFDVYRRIGYPVVCTSWRTGEGIEELKQTLSGAITVLAGPSGVGKTSLINRIANTTLLTSAVSEATGKGRHTTRAATLIAVGEGFVADTAGIRALAVAGVERDDLDMYFRELQPFRGKCRFANCRHVGELGCAIEAALERGEIEPLRLDSYRALRDRFDED